MILRLVRKQHRTAPALGSVDSRVRWARLPRTDFHEALDYYTQIRIPFAAVQS
jgi:hypothetical protein